MEAGADKVSLNTAALKNPALITTLAKRYGSQAVIVAIDAKRRDDQLRRVRAQRHVGRRARRRRVGAARPKAHGAGEILLTSMDRDGTRAGFDCEMTAAVSDAVNIPVIASGGAGTFDHFTDVFTRGHADAALAASIFHYAESSVADLKRHLRERGIPMRLVDRPRPMLGGSAKCRLGATLRPTSWQAAGRMAPLRLVTARGTTCLPLEGPA